MGSEIQHYDSEENGKAVAISSNDILGMVIAAAKDDTINADKMRAMATLAMDMQKHQLEMDKLARQEQFNRDLNAAIDEMPVITKTGRIIIPGKNGTPDRVQGSFARFEDLNRIVKPILSRHNLTISFVPGARAGTPGGVAVAPVIRHSNGIVKEYEPLPLPIEDSGSKNAAQAIGSSISYGKRYGMCAVLNITVESEDDDGSGGKRLMPEERGNLVIEEATAAYDDGNYDQWFKAQSPKDRAWLVQNGHHARFGGAPALTGPAPKAEARKETPPAQDRKPETTQQDKPPADTVPREAKDWTDAYVARVNACKTLDALAQLQDDEKRYIAKIKNYPTLWPLVTQAQGDAYDRLSGAGNEDASGGNDLFKGGDQ